MPTFRGRTSFPGTSLREMSARDPLVAFLTWSGLVLQSVDELRPDLPRWRERLAAWGVAEFPVWDAGAGTSFGTARAYNLLNLLLLQARADGGGKAAHDLRNLTRVRPYKP